MSRGRVERGLVAVGQQVEIVGMNETISTTVTGVEMFHKTLTEGEPGDALGVLIRGIEREGVERGQVLAAPGTITPHTEYEAQVYVLSKEEGGRHTPFFSGYKPQVLHSHHRRDRRDRAERGRRDGHARGQHRDEGEAYGPGRPGRTTALRRARGGSGPWAPASSPR